MQQINVKNASKLFTEDIIDALGIIGRAKTDTSNNYKDAVKLVQARVTNLEANLHIEIDMERIEDRSKALSYIGIEVADALKGIPTPVELTEEGQVSTAEQEYLEETRVNAKPTLWQRIKQSKVARALTYAFKARLTNGENALPEGRGE